MKLIGQILVCLTLLWPVSANAITCGFGTDIGGGVCRGFLTSPTGSNQTFTSPSDWNNASNTIEVIGGGGSGGITVSAHATGGGGGGYSSVTNFTFASPGTTTATYQIGDAGAAVVGTSNTAGNAGGSTWFNGTTLAGSTVGAVNGSAGKSGSGSQTGGNGGNTILAIGTTKRSGGAGGDLTGASGSGGSGGGGAAGGTGNGNDGANSSSTGSQVRTTGGSADNGGTGAGAGGALGAAGGNGTEWDASHGSGGGGGGASTTTAGGDAGDYGGGGGGARLASGTITSGAGKQGIIVITYTASSASGIIPAFALPPP